MLNSMQLSLLFNMLVQISFGIESASCSEQSTERRELLARGYQSQQFSAVQLKKWQIVGSGRLTIDHDQLVMSEVEDSKGFMLVSPEIYGRNVVVGYDVMVLRPATVLITNLAASNRPDGALTFPKDYDGNAKVMFETLNMYMMVAHNAAHNKPGPFIRRYPLPGNSALVTSQKNIMRTGQYYHVEAGKEGDQLWYKINGKAIVCVKDPDPHDKGKVILRIRGTGHEIASILLKNVIILRK